MEHSRDMKHLVFSDAASYRGRLKKLASEVIRIHFHDTLEPEIEGGHNSEDIVELVASNVKGVFDNSLFLFGPPGKEVRSILMNFECNALCFCLPSY
jgi:hypothetical protein